jgi:predicted transcriptional regulator of viral defense system
MLENSTHAKTALRVAKERGIARARDFRVAGVPAPYITRLCKQGRLIRLGRGLYQLPDFQESHAAHDLAEVARLVPLGVISLLSALRIHGLTTQLPHSVWLTLPSKARAPRYTPFPYEIVRASEPALSAGRTTIRVEGVDVPIYDAAKTVVDCFKYRRRVGIDIAVEALRDALRQRKATRAGIWRYAEICRVRHIMRPYLEALA